MKSLELPLFVSRIPSVVADWLDCAGIPTHEWSEITDTRNLPAGMIGKFLLFDSHDDGSKRVAATADRNGLDAIDVGSLCDNESTGEMGAARSLRNRAATDSNESPGVSQRLRFMQKLKVRVEAAGGVWARIGDFPFPYRSALFAPETPDSPDATLHQPDVSALIWDTSPDEYRNWRRCRRKISFRLYRRRARYIIHSVVPSSLFVPVLEVWKGRHVAAIPLQEPNMTVAEDRLVYRRDENCESSGGRESLPDGLFDQESSHVLLAVGA